MARLGFLDLCDRARAAVAKGDLAGARKNFDEALRIKPDSADVHYGLATVCYLAKDYATATRHFQQVQEIDPLHAGASINLGALCNLQGEYEQAIAHLRRGIQLDRTRSEGYYNLGIAYRKQGRYELAIQAYREAHHLNPRMVEAVYNLANIYYEMERYEQAVSHYKQAIEINPGFRKAREGLKRAERKVHEENEAKPDDDASDPQLAYDATIEHNEKLDRQLDPERDLDLLIQLHNATGGTNKRAQEWLALTLKLDEAIRNLAIGLTSESSSHEFAEALTAFRNTFDKFQTMGDKFAESFESVSKVRNDLIDSA